MAALLPSVNVSTNVSPESTTLPLFSTVIVYVITSPEPVSPSPLSVTAADLVTSKIGDGVIVVIVGSFTVFPSVSSPSSLTSDTSLVLPGLLAVTVARLITLPVLAADCSITSVSYTHLRAHET